MTEQIKPDRAMVTKTWRLIRQWTKEEEGKPKNWWGGVAPSYLCAEFAIDYDEACAILLDLQVKGFIYDNGNGNYHKLEDGRTCSTRFYKVPGK